MEEVKREGVDILIALDVSKSMLAEDIAPNRLAKAKYEIREFISKLKGDRVGIIPFAGIAYTHCPLTLDYGAALLFLDFVNEKTIPYQGTSISSAIETAIHSFPEKNKKYKVLLIITDGEDHEEEVEALAQKAKEEGIVIYTIGIGSLEGVPIPDYNANGERIAYKKDQNGDIILTKLNAEILKDIAEANNGRFFHVTPQNPELDMIHQEISQMEKQEYGEKQFTSFEDRYQYILILAIILIFIDFMISERAKASTEWKGRFQ
jgi:Ca-activated chloride channel family protein